MRVLSFSQSLSLVHQLKLFLFNHNLEKVQFRAVQSDISRNFESIKEKIEKYKNNTKEVFATAGTAALQSSSTTTSLSANIVINGKLLGDGHLMETDHETILFGRAEHRELTSQVLDHQLVHISDQQLSKGNQMGTVEQSLGFTRRTVSFTLVGHSRKKTAHSKEGRGHWVEVAEWPVARSDAGRQEDAA